MKKILLTSGLILVMGTTSLMAEGGKGSFHKCVDNAETKAEFQECKKMLKGGKFKGKSLEEMKKYILEKISKREEKLEKAKQCIQNATTKEALKECKPKHKKGGWKKHGKGGEHKGYRGDRD